MRGFLTTINFPVAVNFCDLISESVKSVVKEFGWPFLSFQLRARHGGCFPLTAWAND
jgi:hypothetical protein